MGWQQQCRSVGLRVREGRRGQGGRGGRAGLSLSRTVELLGLAVATQVGE